MLDAYLRGDATFPKDKKEIRVNTISKTLRDRLAILLQLMGYYVRLQESIVPKRKIRRKNGIQELKETTNYQVVIRLNPRAKKLGSNIELIKVIDVEPVEYDRKWVYDLSVESTESFFAGKILVLCHNTNRIQDLDDAFVRVGRFDYLIPVLYPDAEARKSILEVHTSVARKVPLDEDVELTELTERTEGFTGAELEELVVRAARCAFRRNADKVSWDDFEQALTTFRIDAGARDRQRQEYIQLAEQFCNDLSLLEMGRTASTVRRSLRRL